MISKREIVFSTQWCSSNINIKIKSNFLMRFYVKLFFKKWVCLEPKNTNYNVIVNFSLKREKIKKTLFNYSREKNNKTIITSIGKLNLFRAFIRSFYKFLNKEASVVGISELYMAIIRTAIIEPIEYLNFTNGWRLIHASVFKLNNKIFIVSAGSKMGKSTLVSQLSEEDNCEILSDNYCFVKDNKVRSIEEPFRGGRSSRSRISFYGRTISGYPTSFEGEIDYFILLKRGIENQLSNLDFKDLNLRLNQTNKKEKEGVFYLCENDLISVKNINVDFRGNYSLKELEIKEGLENIKTSINFIKNI